MLVQLRRARGPKRVLIASQPPRTPGSVRSSSRNRLTSRSRSLELVVLQNTIEKTDEPLWILEQNPVYLLDVAVSAWRQSR